MMDRSLGIGSNYMKDKRSQFPKTTGRCKFDGIVDGIKSKCEEQPPNIYQNIGLCKIDEFVVDNIEHD